MRGSLLAVIAIALIAGLAAVVVVRNLGLLNPPVVAQPPAKEVAAPATPKVVVAIRHLYEGDSVSPGDLRLRDLRESEAADYTSNKGDYLISSEVAYFRSPAHGIDADRPLKLADLTEAKKPDSLHSRLLPGTRAVDLAIPKENSAGGLIQVGDWVDVYLTTTVTRSDSQLSESHTGVLLQRAPVIAKRGTLYNIYAPLPPGEPIQFTLAANPYRAALVEFARNLGAVTLVPVSAEEKKRLDLLREEGRGSNEIRFSIPFADLDSTEYLNEIERIQKLSRGDLAISNEDLIRVLKLPALPIFRKTTHTVEILNGVKKKDPVTFERGDAPLMTPRYQFQGPAPKEPKPGEHRQPTPAPAPTTPAPQPQLKNGVTGKSIISRN